MVEVDNLKNLHLVYLTGSGHRELCRTAVGARNQCRAAEDESVIQSSQERVPRYFAGFVLVKESLQQWSTKKKRHLNKKMFILHQASEKLRVELKDEELRVLSKGFVSLCPQHKCIKGCQKMTSSQPTKQQHFHSLRNARPL
jgi:hypothetical protein